MSAQRFTRTELERRLTPSNPQLAKAAASLYSRSFQKEVIRLWNKKGVVPMGIAAAILSPLGSALWRRAA
jgi:hypothetical protein